MIHSTLWQEISLIQSSWRKDPHLDLESWEQNQFNLNRLGFIWWIKVSLTKVNLIWILTMLRRYFPFLIESNHPVRISETEKNPYNCYHFSHPQLNYLKDLTLTYKMNRIWSHLYSNHQAFRIQLKSNLWLSLKLTWWTVLIKIITWMQIITLNYTRFQVKMTTPSYQMQQIRVKLVLLSKN